MAVTYSFKTPVSIGAYPTQISVAGVHIASLAFGFQGVAPTTATLQLTLQDPVSGAQFAALQFADEGCLALVRAMLAATNPATGHTFEADLIARAVAATDPVSGKAMVPAGTAA